MRTDDFQRIRHLFEAALEQPRERRQQFLDQACAGDDGLRAEVERMLAADAQTHAFVDPQPRGRASTESSLAACPSCGGALTAAQKFCPECGTPAQGGSEGRFRAGALFANRFRIVAALGRGGMGEVYRAHDLELGQPVALKFLTALRSDERARQRLRNEVRLARQLAHANVCRVYDIGESQSELYLSMEYVDGEDLAALLKRIGRVPVDKGIEIARKLCAGLAAAHAKGVLHRDLKPANIMIDGGGEVRIMDFGIAAVASELDVREIRTGTPAYMAPEQLAGREATVQSDLYALGLVLYELFTGKAPFDARDPNELQRQRESHPSTAPATLIPELGPRVEQAILRCLDPDPKMRPASALDVSAALPGGDPLAEALAAGETPSPELVAASGPSESTSVRVSTWLLASIALGLATIVWLSQQVQTVAMLPRENPPEVLAARARDVLETLGYGERGGDAVFGFRADNGYVEFVNEQIRGSGSARQRQWRDALARGPAPLSFWYRRSDEPLIVRDDANPVRRVTFENPPLWRPGTVSVLLDMNGRLRRFKAIPRENDQGGEGPTDWSALFMAAGLAPQQFVEAPLALETATANGSRRAWTGAADGVSMTGPVPIRVEAGSDRGKVTEFNVILPWNSRPNRFDALSTPPQRLLSAVLTVALIIAFSIVAFLNIRAGRADMRGAWRVAAFVGLGILLAWVVGTRHVTVEDSLQELILHTLRLVAFAGILSAASYLAIEPWVRRYWPHAIVTWSRFVAGRWRDPVVARDVLIGIAVGLISTIVRRAGSLVAMWFGQPPSTPEWIFSPIALGIEKLRGGPVMLADMAFIPLQGFVAAVQLIFLVFVFRVAVRRPWLSICLAIATSIAFQIPTIAEFRGVLGFLLLITPLQIAVGARFGLVTSIAFVSSAMFTDSAILTSRLGAWYGQSSLVGLLVVTTVTLWAYRMSLGGRPVFASPRQ